MMLRAQNLHKNFGGVHALRGVNLHIAGGQIHAVIGPNGAGKSTLLNALCGEVHAEHGEIFLREQNITALPMHRRARLGLARCFQTASVIMPMTLVENVALALQCAGGDFARHFWSQVARDKNLQTQAMQLLSLVGLAEHAATAAEDAAHGMRRQLEFAMVLALQPKVLMLDEPVAGLGRGESVAMIALLKTLKKKCAILLVEHDMDAVFQLADVVSVLVDGRVIKTGGADVVRADEKVQRAYLGS